MSICFTETPAIPALNREHKWEIWATLNAFPLFISLPGRWSWKPYNNHSYHSHPCLVMGKSIQKKGFHYMGEKDRFIERSGWLALFGTKWTKSAVYFIFLWFFFFFFFFPVNLAIIKFGVAMPTISIYLQFQFVIGAVWLGLLLLLFSSYCYEASL